MSLTTVNDISSFTD